MGAPFHVTSLGATQGKDAILGEDIQAERVDAFLVDDNEVFLLLVAADSLVTDKVFELHDLFALRVSEPTLGLDELLPLLR